MKGPKPLPIADRFWSKVDRSAGSDACWPWTAAVSKHGYGMFGTGRRGVDRKVRTASRVAYELTFGEIPSGADYHGICVMHECDNPRCCNPKHLRLGTHAENMRDCIARGRHRDPFTRARERGAA